MSPDNSEFKNLNDKELQALRELKKRILDTGFGADDLPLATPNISVESSASEQQPSLTFAEFIQKWREIHISCLLREASGKPYNTTTFSTTLHNGKNVRVTADVKRTNSKTTNISFLLQHIDSQVVEKLTLIPQFSEESPTDLSGFTISPGNDMFNTNVSPSVNTPYQPWDLEKIAKVKTCLNECSKELR